MLYPVYVHMGDARHAHGVTIPDFPGCFSAADDWAALPAQVQEAVEVYAKAHHLSRSGFLARVASEALEQTRVRDG
jgi:predicted RNase H-like HicB family nuclease